MKKIAFILVSIFLFTGCTTIKIENISVEDTINTIIEKDINLYNRVFEGYKFYLPRGLKLITKNDYNMEILSGNDTFYLYVDIISRYYKTKKNFEVKPKNYLSKELRYNEQLGYIDVIKTNEKFFIEFMYNHAKIEAFIEEDKLNEAILNMAYILSSIQYNDEVIKTFVGGNSLDYKEEEYNIFETQKEDSNFLEYYEKYDNYEADSESKNDEDFLDYEILE